MSAYEALAASYDRLTDDVAYRATADYLERLLAAAGKHPKSVLDLACGTGSLSMVLAERGYRVLGADLSEEMLAVAYGKAMALPKDKRPYFIHQAMQRLRLPYAVDCAVCCLDSLNYVTDPADCRETLRRVHAALAPGGVFLFDVNTPENLRAMDGQVFLDEDDDVYCVWRGAYDTETRICSYGMDLFQRRGRLWRRSFEEHCEYAYEPEELRRWLEEAGFTDVTVYGDRSMEPPQPGAQRIYFAAYKEE